MENEIREKVFAYCKAVEKQDQNAFRTLFSHDATLISIATLFSGIDSIIQDFLGKIQSAYRSIKLIPEDISVRFPGNDMAIVVFQYHTECILRKDGSEYGISGLETQIFTRFGNKWKLTHVHYSKR